MAQGIFKLKPNKATKASKLSHQKKQISKGRREFTAKGRKSVQAKQDAETSKAINRKNEATVAARAVGAGCNFYLNDIKQAGKNEIKKKNTALKKREKKSAKMSERLQEKIKKLT